MNKLETLMVRSVERETKINLRMVSLKLNVTVGEALKIIINEYLENHKGK